MSKYHGTYLCGHTGDVNIIGPVTDRERKRIHYFSNLCPECHRKHQYEKREKEIEDALELATEWELPLLKGSKKQIAWANCIRMRTMKSFYEKCSFYTPKQAVEYFYKQTGKEHWSLQMIDALHKLQAEELIQLMEDYLINQNDSSWWIDNNKTNIFSFLFPFSLADSIKQDEQMIENIYLADTIVSPKEVQHDGIVSIFRQGIYMAAVYPKDEVFSSIAHSCLMSWNGRWERTLTEMTGLYQDRAGELGNILLNHGFRVSIQEENAREKAIHGTYEPECHRWIRKMNNQNAFHIIFPYDEEIAKLAMRLPYARWVERGIVVDLVHYKEVDDFAYIFDFKFTKECQEMVDSYSDILNHATCIVPVLKPVKEQINKLEIILKDAGAIISDLQDDG